VPIVPPSPIVKMPLQRTAPAAVGGGGGGGVSSTRAMTSQSHQFTHSSTNSKNGIASNCQQQQNFVVKDATPTTKRGTTTTALNRWSNSGSVVTAPSASLGMHNYSSSNNVTTTTTTASSTAATTITSRNVGVGKVVSPIYGEKSNVGCVKSNRRKPTNLDLKRAESAATATTIRKVGVSTSSIINNERRGGAATPTTPKYRPPKRTAEEILLDNLEVNWSVPDIRKTFQQHTQVKPIDTVYAKLPTMK